MKRLITVLLAFGVSSMGVRTADASTITISIGPFSGGSAVLHAPGTLADGLAVYLGSVLITGDLGTFESYCVDLQHYELPGANVTTLDTMANWNNTASPSHASLGPAAASWLYLTYRTAAAGNQALEAALSLAIWNALYDDDFDVTSGSGFYATSISNPAYATTANQYLDALALQDSAQLPYARWLRTSDGPNYRSQDFIAPVPEPGSLALLGIGLGVATYRAKRRTALK